MNAPSQAADSNRNPAPAPSSRFHVSLTSALLWADALQYDLFVCLGIPTRHPEPSRADQEPLPRSWALPAGAHCPGCFHGVLFSSQWGRCIQELHPTANPPKTMLLAGQGLRLGLCSSDCQGSGAGFRRGKRLCPNPSIQNRRSGACRIPLGSQIPGVKSLLAGSQAGMKPR